MMKHDGRLQEGFVACHIVAPLLSTLQLLHKLGIVHRDVKTEVCSLSLPDNPPHRRMCCCAMALKSQIRCNNSATLPPFPHPSELLHDSQRRASIG